MSFEKPDELWSVSEVLIGSSVPSDRRSTALLQLSCAWSLQKRLGSVLLLRSKGPWYSLAWLWVSYKVPRWDGTGVPFSYHYSGLVLASLYPAGLGVVVFQKQPLMLIQVHLPVPKSLLRRKSHFCVCVRNSPLNFEVAVG